ncbi:MAG: hypothetical protein LBD59_06340 [Prevotellaceae bacterium]|nr:hypothetical protein [Prevotellaceae bacterium]
MFVRKKKNRSGSTSVVVIDSVCPKTQKNGISAKSRRDCTLLTGGFSLRQRPRHVAQVPQGLHIKSTNSTFRPYGTVVTRRGLRFLPTFRPYGTAVTCIRVFGRTLCKRPSCFFVPSS